MTPVEFAATVDRCDAVLAAARVALTEFKEHPPTSQDQAERDATLLCLDAVAVVDAAQRMLRRPFVESRGAVLRRIVEAGMIATSETAAAVRLWGPAAKEWDVLAHECERCRDAMRALLSAEVHDPGEMSGAT